MSESGLSYADVVASGPQQSAEEARAPPVPEIEPSIQSVDSLVDVNSGSVVVVNPDFLDQEVKTETQASRLEMEAEAADEHARAAAESKRAQKAAEIKEQKKINANKEQAKKDKTGKKDYNVPDDPIVRANGLAFAIVTIALAFGAYRKHQVGQLTWKLAGTWAAGITALAGADYALSKHLGKKFPFYGLRKE